MAKVFTASSLLPRAHTVCRTSFSTSFLSRGKYSLASFWVGAISRLFGTAVRNEIKYLRMISKRMTKLTFAVTADLVQEVVGGLLQV